MYFPLNERYEYISSDNIVNLYFLETSAISSKFLQIAPDGLFGEFKKSNKFLFLIFFAFSSICLES